MDCQINHLDCYNYGREFICKTYKFKVMTQSTEGLNFTNIKNGIVDDIPKITFLVDSSRRGIWDNVTLGRVQKIFFIRTYKGDVFLKLKGVRIK
jgi:hypothetical protein